MGLCGASRPVFFRGEATIVSKLFNIIEPDVAVFGKKDYQQWRVICRMVRDLDFAIEIIGSEIMREADGAMSSRNVHLSREEREKALSISRSLVDARTADVTMTTMDAIIDHIIYSQVNSFHNQLHFECIKNMILLNDENIYIYLFRSEQHIWASIWMLNKPVVVHHEMKINSSTFWNPIRPPDEALNSNGRQIYVRTPFQAHEYLMESFQRRLSNGSCLSAKFHLSHQQLKKQGIGLICTGKINNHRRDVSVAKAQHNNVSYGCSRVDNLFSQIVVISTHRKIRAPLLTSTAALKGNTDCKQIKNKIVQTLTETGGQVDYVEIVEQESLVPVEKIDGTVVICVAAWFGKVRLIDNIEIDTRS